MIILLGIVTIPATAVTLESPVVMAFGLLQQPKHSNSSSTGAV